MELLAYFTIPRKARVRFDVSYCYCRRWWKQSCRKTCTSQQRGVPFLLLTGGVLRAPIPVTRGPVARTCIRYLITGSILG